jgi:SAM-dependent methyltransferase
METNPRKDFLSTNVWQALAAKASYFLFEAPKGFGKPVSKEFIERQYREGAWDFLNTIDELANYMIVVGYIRHFSKSLKHPPRVLDLGCGTGNIAELLRDGGSVEYLGLDVSDEAIAEARSRNIEGAAFRKASFEDPPPDEEFDFIISTGAIHYARNPWLVLENYSKCLSGNGKFVISLWRHRATRGIWRKIEKHFETFDSTVVSNRKGVTWDVKILRK